MVSQPYENILVSRKDGVGIITLDRPRVLNALSFSLMQELDQAILELDDNEEVGAIVITGSGEKAFSAGADIHEMANLSEEENLVRQGQRWEYLWKLATCRKPTIGAINGLAFGGGALMASAMDLRIGCDRSQFRFLAATYGRVNSTWTLPLLVGLPAAKDLLYTGRLVEADEAFRMGLLNRLVPRDQVMAEAVQMAQVIAKNHPRMVQGIKELIHDGIGLSWREQRDAEWEALQGKLLGVPTQEGFREFLDRKGRPNKKN